MSEQKGTSPLVYVAMVLSVVAIVISGLSLKGVADSKESGVSQNSKNTASDVAVTTAAKTEAATTKSPYPVNGTEVDVDGWHIKIISLKKGYTDHVGNPVVMLTYELTNNTGSTARTPSYGQFKAFQKGMSLDFGLILNEPDNYLFTGELQNGTTITASCSFGLKDENFPVSIEFYDDGTTILTYEFTI